MGLLDEVKVALRVKGSATDSEIETWIAAAKADMMRVGVKPNLLSEQSMDPLAKAAVIAYAKAAYGYDVEERALFEAAYRSIVISLMNSSANSASGGSDV